MTDPNNSTTHYRYIGSYRKIQEIRAGRQTHRYNYGSAGNLINTPSLPLL